MLTDTLLEDGTSPLKTGGILPDIAVVIVVARCVISIVASRCQVTP